MAAPIRGRGGACSVPGCTRVRLFRQPDFCRLHYRRWKKTGTPGPVERLRGPDGEGTISSGYRVLRVNGRLIAQHRLIMEGALGRSLHSWEQVHHLNGDKLDNRLKNLELWCTSHPYGARVSDLVAFVVQHYPDEVKAAAD